MTPEWFDIPSKTQWGPPDNGITPSYPLHSMVSCPYLARSDAEAGTVARSEDLPRANPDGNPAYRIDHGPGRANEWISA